MTDSRPELPEAPAAPPATGRVHDRRLVPRGTLPRQLQTWLMVAVAGVMLVIILLTGHQAPPPPPSGERAQPPTLPPPDRIRGFQERLAADDTRRQTPPTAMEEMAGKPFAERPSAAPVADGGLRRLEASLFADNVAFSRRAGIPSSPAAVALGTVLPPGSQAGGQTEQAWDPLLLALAANATSRSVSSPVGPTPPPAPAPALPASVPLEVPPSRDAPDRGTRHRLLEGTVIEAVLLNRLDGTYAGPVTAMVTTPVHSQDRRYVVIPAGARVLGTAAAVQSWGDTRLAISFHRLLMPDGQAYSLDQFKGLNQIGETGLRDQVNRHYWRVFGASLAIGALSGLAQVGTRSGIDLSVGDSSRQAAGTSLATSTARILDRYLNVLPTLTIREGYRLKVYLTDDLDLPAYPPPSGGIR